MGTTLDRREFLQGTAAGIASCCMLGCDTEKETEVVATGSPPPPLGKASRDELAATVLKRIKMSGAEYGDLRVLRTTRQRMNGRDRRLAGINDGHDYGLGIRVLFKGAWGFAATSIVDLKEAERTAQHAVEIAKASAELTHDPVRLASEPVHKAQVVTPRKIDPFSVSVGDRTALLKEVMDVLHKEKGIQRSSAWLWAQRDEKLFASTEGSHIEFDLLAINGGLRATAVHEGKFASRSFYTPYLRTGYELIQDAKFTTEATRVAREAVEKVQAPGIDPGKYDLLLDPAHLALTIHESCGHPTELDRALGYEANFAGTSFLTPDKLKHFQYGSKHVSLVADNTESGTLAATGYDDDGVVCQKWDIVRDGVFVGYSSNREVAPKIGAKRSAGSNRADGWRSIPMVRIANIGLEPGQGHPDELLADIKRGIYIEGRGSFSIDQRRYNFQFGGDAFWYIENGKKKHMLSDVIYHGITPEFWAKCDGVAGQEHRRRFGFITCGKGQPMQSGWMTHAAAPARFRKVDVMRGKTKG